MLGVAMCGGESSRMGEDKGAMVVRDGIPQLVYIVDLLDKLCMRVGAAVGRRSRELPEGVMPILDVPSISGPMAGVLAALREAQKWDWPVLVVACDMPYVEPSHLVLLANRRDREKQATAFMAKDGEPDPMCAIYEPSCLPLMEAVAAEGQVSLRAFLKALNTEHIDLADPYWLASVNDVRELDEARRLLSENRDDHPSS